MAGRAPGRRRDRGAAPAGRVRRRGHRDRPHRARRHRSGGGAHLLGFVAGQTGRGLQLEAPVTAWFLWQAVAGVDGAFVYYDTEILTFQVTGPNVDLVIAAMTPVLALAVVAIAALGAARAWRGVSFAALFPR
nr:hypothetical protein GCM10025699_20520 [Microbacterium flavescens]